MNSDGPRDPAINSGEAVDRKPEGRSAVTHQAGKTRLALGGVAAMLLLAAAAYYFTGPDTGTGVARRPAPDNTPAATPAPAPEAAVKSAPSAASAPTPSPQQQSAAAPPAPGASSPQEPRAAAPAPEPQATAPVTTAPEPANVAPPATSTPPAQSAEAAPKTPEPSAAPPAAPSSMRDQPAALPDQAAAAPKTETTMVVMRGPANIRSAPGKGGRVIGTAAKNATVKELSRSGKWVEVETESGTGWIAASLLAPRSQ